MGSPNNEVGRFGNEGPAWPELSSALWMAATPVTLGQYRSMAPEHRDRWDWELRLPVTGVSWFDAVLFAEWLQYQRERRDLTAVWNDTLAGVPSGSRLRLPTEAEWEFAVRAGSTDRWCFGDDERQLGEFAWFDDNSEWRPHTVATRLPNSWGLHDVHGNVWEWCYDWYEEEPIGGLAPYGSASGRGRAVRGGSYWGDAGGGGRAAFRDWVVPDSAWVGRGFRLCIAAPEPEGR
ncbi:MAG: formylglycine-generating enzyme family protein [Planctomycetes bacterium]|nr:formylglycine-generating enzyme family protein [Planctomycetota bacterium]